MAGIRRGKNADIGREVPGALGTKTNGSITLRNLQNGGRIDVENLNPGKRPGNLHYQNREDPTKYIYNDITDNFRINTYNGNNAPKAIQKLLNNQDVRSAINQGLKILGLPPSKSK